MKVIENKITSLVKEGDVFISKDKAHGIGKKMYVTNVHGLPPIATVIFGIVGEEGDFICSLSHFNKIPKDLVYRRES